MADVGVDHRLSPHFECKTAGVPRNPERLDIDRDAALGFVLHLIRGKPGRNMTIKRNIHDLGPIQIFRKDHRTGFIGQSLNDAFFLQGSKMAHGRRLTGEAEVPLDLPSRRHQALLLVILTQESEQFLLSVRQFGGVQSHHDSLFSGTLGT